MGLYLLRNFDDFSQDQMEVVFSEEHLCIVHTRESFTDPIGEPLASLIWACRDYTPAEALVNEDMRFYLRRYPELPLEEATRLLTLALRHHLTRQPVDSAMYLPRVGTNNYHWVVGYVNQDPIRGILYVEDRCLYPGDCEDFGITKEEALARFPDTPVHYIDPRSLGGDYIPPSLKSEQPCL